MVVFNRRVYFRLQALFLASGTSAATRFPPRFPETVLSGNRTGDWLRIVFGRGLSFTVAPPAHSASETLACMLHA
jgi:hypothetical protein